MRPQQQNHIVMSHEGACPAVSTCEESRVEFLVVVFSSPCTKRLFARILNMQYKHPPPGLPGARKCSKTRGEVCNGVAPRPIRDSPPAAVATFPSP